MSKIYCDHSSDIHKLQEIGVADIDTLLEYTNETVSIEPELYAGDEDYILKNLPSEAHKLYCLYCDEMGYNPYTFVINNVETPVGTNFVTLKKKSDGKYQQKEIEQKDNSPSSSVMYAHLPYDLD